MRHFMEPGKSIWLFDTESGEDTAVKDLFLTAYEAFRQEPRGYEFVVRDALSRMLLLVMDDAYSAKKQTVIQDHRHDAAGIPHQIHRVSAGLTRKGDGSTAAVSFFLRIIQRSPSHTWRSSVPP